MPLGTPRVSAHTLPVPEIRAGDRGGTAEREYRGLPVRASVSLCGSAWLPSKK